MSSFLSGLFTGSNPTLQGNINNAGNIEGFGTSVGEGDITNASDFNNTLLAGDPAKTAKLLAPQIGAITGQGQQQKKTLAEFGNRSGGNNSEASTIDDKTRGNIDDMISKLTGSAATNAGNLGISTLGLGLSANEQQAKLSQEQLQNQKNSLLGQGITGAVDMGETALGDELGGLGGGVPELNTGGGMGITGGIDYGAPSVDTVGLSNWANSGGSGTGLGF
jgi:hypothetical protein